MAKSNEQINIRHTKSSFAKKKRFLKKQVTRLRRRQGKELLEDAPPRSTGGWVD